MKRSKKKFIQERSTPFKLRTLNLLLAEKRKAALLGKYNYSSIDRVGQDIWGEKLQIYTSICQSVLDYRSIARGSQKHPRFL